MKDRLPTPEELWGPDYREHLQRQFDIYDAAVARERAEIAARNAASSPSSSEPDPLISLLETLPTSNDLGEQPVVEFSVADALAPPPSLEWCVESLFARPSLTVLVGDPGSKKTLTVIDLAVCVAMGKPWLGHAIGEPGRSVIGQSPVASPTRGEATQGKPWLDHPVTQGAVLFIDEQTGPRQLLARFNAALNAHGATAETPIHIHSLAGHSLRDKDSADTLIKLARSRNTRLIVIDAFSNLLRGGSESSLAAVLPVVFHLRRLAEACQAAVVVTHHTNRHGFFRGSYAIAAAADLLLSIRSKPDEPTTHLTTLKSRFLAPKPFSARANFETSPNGAELFSFSRVAGSPSSADAPPTDPWLMIPPHRGVVGEAFLIYDDIFRNPNSSFKELHSRNLAWREGTLRNCIQQLLDEGVIERSNPGGQGTEARYSLARPP